MNAPLQALEISSPGSEPSACAYVLHGILGSAKNWRTFGRRLAARFPSWRIVLVDLRHHGDSPHLPPPNTLAACAADLERLSAAREERPSVVIGHSFGGKVALEWAGLINSKSPTAMRMLKFGFNMIDDGMVGQQLFAGEATRLAYGTDEAQEGRDAFLEKRPQDFTKFPWHY